MSVSKRGFWTGRILTGLAVAFLVLDAGMKVLRVTPVLQATAQLGFPDSSILLTGVLLLACTIVYVIPRTSVLGAILLTGYLGGATAAQVRVGNPAFETVFPTIVGLVIWSGIVLRDGRLRQLFPVRAL